MDYAANAEEPRSMKKCSTGARLRTAHSTESVFAIISTTPHYYAKPRAISYPSELVNRYADHAGVFNFFGFPRIRLLR
jgi:hypothetical protein